jgi:hypothetical protein
VNKRQTFFIAALEAAILVAISLSLVLVPLTLVWFLENNPEMDWLVAFRAAADFWLLSHGVGLVVPEGELLGLLVPAFMVTLVPLGMRSLWPGWLGGGLVYGAAALGISTAAYDSVIYPIAWQGVFFPTILFLSFQVLGSLFGQPDEIFEGDVLDQAPERDRIRQALNSFRLKLHWSVRSIIGPAFRAGSAITVMLLIVSAFTIAVLIALSWIDITRLYESVQVSILGAVVLTIGQLALIPNLVIYGAAWLTGVGFSIGAGSLISPLGSQVGPLPAIPILGALPVGQLEFGMVSIAVVLLAAFIATLAIRKSADEIRFEFATAWTAAISLGLSIAFVTASQMGILALIASGSAGPGRLSQVGVSPWVLALVVFVEVGVVSTLAAFYSARPVADKPGRARKVG